MLNEVNIALLSLFPGFHCLTKHIICLNHEFIFISLLFAVESVVVESFAVESSVVVPVDLNGTSIEMQIDTGATMSIMSRSVYSSLWKVSPPLERCDMTLKTYSGVQLPVIGKTYVLARYKGQSEQLPLLIVENSGPTLLGLDWLQHLRLDWSEVNLLATSSRQLVGILQEHSKLFQQGLGTFTGAPVDIQLLPNVPHKFFKARSVPFVLKDQIEMELDLLMSEGVITHIKSSSWAAPTVPRLPLSNL